jgi:hypothetical protein
LLHIGCGKNRLEGWVNVDRSLLPGVDVVANVRDGLSFARADAVFAEHFIEHLPLVEGLRFLRSVHGILGAGGHLRISTPNVDWVWVAQYRLEAAADERARLVLELNRGFYGFGHRFLWNEPLLRQALVACGYGDIRSAVYGESELPLFRGLERHEKYGDSPELPHVIILEAAKDEYRQASFEALMARIEEAYLRSVEPSEAVGWREEALRWRREVTRLGQEVTRLGREVTRLGQELTRLSSELAAEHRLRVRAAEQYAELVAFIRHLEASPSLRLVRPLSAAARFLRRRWSRWRGAPRVDTTEGGR